MKLSLAVYESGKVWVTGNKDGQIESLNDPWDMFIQTSEEEVEQKRAELVLLYLKRAARLALAFLPPWKREWGCRLMHPGLYSFELEVSFSGTGHLSWELGIGAEEGLAATQLPAALVLDCVAMVEKGEKFTLRQHNTPLPCVVRLAINRVS